MAADRTDSSRDEVDLQLFLARTADTIPDQQDGFPSFAFMAAPRGATREAAPSIGSGTVASDAESSDYVVIANSEVVETVRLPFGREELLRVVGGVGTNQLRMQDYISFGVRLFDFVFHRRVRDLYRDLYKTAESENKVLRVTIATSAPKLAVMPWELMCDTYPQLLPSFVCHQSRVRLTRALRLFNRVFFEQKRLGEDGELRILAVSAVPPGTFEIEAAMDGRMIDFVRKQVSSVRITLDRCDDATVERLRDKLHAFKPHIVHLACHAGYDADEDFGIVHLMPSPGARSDGRVHSYRLAMLMHEVGTVQCVFANTCFGAQQSNSTIFSGIAQALHAVGIPNVVALQFALADTTAHAMVLGFYSYLLRGGLSIEESVNELRRRMFIEGYSPSETFGLVVFQTNNTLRLRSTETQHKATIATSVTAVPDEFVAAQWQQIEAEQQSEVAPSGWKIEGDWAWITRIPLSDVLTAYQIFGSLNIALTLFQSVREVFAPTGVSGEYDDMLPTVNAFVLLAKRAQWAAMSAFETHPLQTGFVMLSEAALNQYRTDHGLDANTTTGLSKHLFEMHDGDILKLAIKVDGEHRALVVTLPPDSKTVVQRLTLDGAPPLFPRAMARWWPLAKCSASGCAFALLGRGRIKMFIGGKQVLELTGGRWLPADLTDAHRRLSEIARNQSADERIVLDLFEKCLVASEKSTGKAFILQGTDAILDRWVSKGFDPGADVLAELRNCPVTEIEPRDYLAGAGGDHAVLIARNGHTLGVNVPLAPSAETKVDRVPGTGARHLSAQQITKETDALALVTSADGPISVFCRGDLVMSYLRVESGRG